MATIQSSFQGFRPSSAIIRVESPPRVTAVTPFPRIPGRQPALQAINLIAMPKEPEDAFLTGGTRSLDRRLLALNLPGSLPMRNSARPAAASERLAPLPQSAVA